MISNRDFSPVLAISELLVDPQQPSSLLDTPIVKLLNYAESVAKRLKSALPGSTKYYLIIRRTEL